MATDTAKQAESRDCRIVPFPLKNRAATVRQSAEILDTTHGEAALVFWRAQCRSLADELLALGCSEDDMREQVFNFQNEVQAELMRRHWEADARDYPMQMRETTD
ncbi:hypothetical protein IFT84_07350 [Rhizobium sp. CFBP 8762]|uniref:DUF6074 family protein n=1 Tax=Rhizobium sp. CFBP 8762 TaxID=2775279 RepID=UPI00177C711F|nr:DUF6074 family protein [Rhizobium sp. CFBP 8762]MBD8554341.1 hypothetical protein [Rhizobium sp. CFBP 8762]